jgi:hypothetical protein
MSRFFFLIFTILSCTGVLAQEALDVQPSSSGTMEGSLIKAKVRKNVLTIQIKVKAGDQKASLKFNFEAAYYTDLNENKKYFPLKDAEGQMIAGPKYDLSHGGRFWEDLEPGQQRIIWIKFPGPAEDTSAVDVFLPGFLPFEDISITR